MPKIYDDVNWTADEGGYIYREDPDALAAYFQAPDKFLGDKSAAYGGTLRFDFRPNWLGEFNPGPQLVLIGNGSVLYRTNVPSPDTTSWSTRLISLSESSDWHFSSEFGAAPSADQFRSVLGNLSGLYIYGDWISGYETTSLDNVVLSAVPVPGAALLGTIGLMMISSLKAGRRKKPAV